MSKFNELMQTFVNMEKDELLTRAGSSLVKLMPVFKALDTENDGMMMLIAVLNAALGADGKLTVKEKEFLMELLNLTSDNIDTLIGVHTGKEEELASVLFKALPDDDLKFELFQLLTAIVACDETIDRNESAFIAGLFN